MTSNIRVPSRVFTYSAEIDRCHQKKLTSDEEELRGEFLFRIVEILFISNSFAQEIEATSIYQLAIRKPKL